MVAHGTSASRAGVRGFTLVELLVVLGILLALAALSLPLVHGMVERRRFEGAVDEVVGMLLLARAHARLEAMTVEVVVVSGPRQSQYLIARGVELGSFGMDEEADDPPSPLATSWAMRRLPSDLRVNEEPAHQGGEEFDEGAGTEPQASVEPGQVRHSSLGAARDDAGDQAVRRLALFASDGSAPIAGRFVLLNDQGRTAAVRVNPWTGYASIEEVSPAPEDDTATAAEIGDG